ncbi:hypothetical protein L486_03948 [Kwoniella mangroviensis CBS 10435]|uniref:Uncharacterized protein n=1 Tax=Kwoniella mangroviensis CBS 10435 TaxID=1331196 RepID=A0A1B9IQU3_9TREE|nr:uncharacterized protein I203_02964 [Kwoniella mangroviensis CBS 8507]OCF57925.1 hypothetical protein L486_03948 [Kwoniella mangroviensis CBS 10435]OCF68297.1 hypothetical protein I203_02964 [Kwoniella mangroviensis CBS 8507]
MAPFSPLPPTAQITRALQPPRYPLLFGQTKQHDFSQPPSKPKVQSRRGPSTPIEQFFHGGHLSLGILFCLFIATLWLLAAFSAAQMSISLPSPSDMVYMDESMNEAGIWGEVGMYELSAWRRIRLGEEGEGQGLRWKRNEAVLGMLKEKEKESKSSMTTGTTITSSHPAIDNIPISTSTPSSVMAQPSSQQKTGLPSPSLSPSLSNLEQRGDEKPDSLNFDDNMFQEAVGEDDRATTSSLESRRHRHRVEENKEDVDGGL